MEQQVSMFSVPGDNPPRAQLEINQVLANYSNEGWRLVQAIHQEPGDSDDVYVALYFSRPDKREDAGQATVHSPVA